MDSHFDLPKVEKEEPDLREVELSPFRAAVEAKVGSVMTAHVIFPAFDEDLPATLSPKVLRRLLRKEMKYDGVVFSDDLEMKAVAGRWPIEEIVQRGTDAGVDLFLCCREPELQVRAFEALVQQQQDARAFARSCRASAGRVHRMRERFWKKPRAPIGLDVVGTMQHRELAALAAERGKP